MTGQIIDLNRTSISSMTMFHFKYSLRPFILATMNDNHLFVDLTYGTCIAWEDLQDFDLYFYTKEDDDDFCGVEIIGDINY